MLWLALYFPDLPLERFANSRQQDAALAVSHQVGGRELVARCNDAAAAHGVHPGMPLPAALALCETLQIHARDPGAEQKTLQELAAWAYQFSAQIGLEPSLLLLEVGASLRLFGGLDKLLQRVLQGVRQLGQRSRWAVAPTPMAAALLARNGCGTLVQRQEELAARLAPIPLARFTRDPETRKLIANLGLYTLGECLQLPRAELARRNGPALLLLLDRLLGQAPDPRAPWQPPARFEQTLELAAEIRHHSALAFPAQRLLVGLCGYLRGRGAGTQRLQWSLGHREAPPTRFDQGLLGASRDVEHILELFRERIERVRLPEPVVRLQLRVDDCLPFGERSDALLPQGEPLPDRQLLERLRNRLGNAHVQGLRVLPDHRPERAWQLCAPGQAGAVATSNARQPPWLLREPMPLDLQQGMPDCGGPLHLQGLPRRIESGWWDGLDIARDYFIALSPAGARLWLFRDRRSGDWFLHGLFT